RTGWSRWWILTAAARRCSSHTPDARVCCRHVAGEADNSGRRGLDHRHPWRARLKVLRQVVSTPPLRTAMDVDFSDTDRGSQSRRIQWTCVLPWTHRSVSPHPLGFLSEVCSRAGFSGTSLGGRTLSDRYP